MLTGLYIQNMAVIEKLSIDFDSGLNVFTGETGAGKSVVISALNAVIGGRVSKDIVRNGKNKAVISAMFSEIPDQICKKLHEFGIDEEGELVIQREIISDGRSTARICGRPVTAGMLKEIGTDLINIHGQHDNQILLSPERHIDIIDNFGGLGDILNEYKKNYYILRKIERELSLIREEQLHKEQAIEMLTYKINEISAAELELGEEEELENEVKIIRNSTKIVDSLHEAYVSMMGTEESEGAADLISSAASAITQAARYYIDLEDLAVRLNSISYEASEIAREVSSAVDGFDYNPARLDAVEARLDIIHRLKRKYGGSIDEILGVLNDSQLELERIETFDSKQNELMVDQKKIRDKMNELSDIITKKRREACSKFVSTVREELAFLEMPNVKIQIRHETLPDFTQNGKDKLEVLISSNPGEPLKPLSKVASGGELSRIMLSIKSALADKDMIPTLIFDEVDSGVSGKAAQKIGLKLKQVSETRQVLCVTHLAQIAALANTHFLIAKVFGMEKTYTEVKNLDKKERINEVARIMSGGELTELMLKSAEQLIESGENHESSCKAHSRGKL